MTGIEHFLERNYIDPIILKYTKFPDRVQVGSYKCGGTCGGWYEREEMQAIVYDSGKRVLRCKKCMGKYKARGQR